MKHIIHPEKKMLEKIIPIQGDSKTIVVVAVILLILLALLVAVGMTLILLMAQQPVDLSTTSSTTSSTTTTSLATTTSYLTTTSTATPTTATSTTITSATTSSTVTTSMATSTTLPESCRNNVFDVGEEEVDCGGVCRSCFHGTETVPENPVIWEKTLPEEEIITCSGTRYMERLVAAANNKSSGGVIGHLLYYDRKHHDLKTQHKGTLGVLDAEISQDGEHTYIVYEDRGGRKLEKLNYRLDKERLIENNSLGDIEITPDGLNHTMRWEKLAANGWTGINTFNSRGRGYITGEISQELDLEIKKIVATPYLKDLVVATASSFISKEKKYKLTYIHHSLAETTATIKWEKKVGDEITALALTEDGDYLAVGVGGELQLYNRGGEKLSSYKTNWGIADIALTGEAEYILAASRDRSMYLLDKEGNLLWRYQIGDPVNVEISPDGSYILACSKTEAIKLPYTDAPILNPHIHLESRIMLLKGPAQYTSKPDTSHCSDHVKNHGETMTDCGGHCRMCPRIECFKDEDCGETGYLHEYHCTEAGDVADYYLKAECISPYSLNATCQVKRIEEIRDECGVGETCTEGHILCMPE